MIALLTEHFGCYNNMMAYSEIWVMNMSDSIPKAYDNDVVKWIYIAWVFRHRSLFWHITRVAIRGSTGEILKQGLPILDLLLGAYHSLFRYFNNCHCKTLTYDMNRTHR